MDRFFLLTNIQPYQTVGLRRTARLRKKRQLKTMIRDIKHLAPVSQAGAEVLRFTRFEVGEGIEKKQEDFAAEVMAQAGKA